MSEQANDIKLPDLPPLSSISKRSANSRQQQFLTTTINEKEETKETIYEHDVTAIHEHDIKTIHDSVLIDRLEAMEDSKSDITDAIDENENFYYMDTDNEESENYDFFH